MKLGLIGDVHGKYHQYLKLLPGYDFTIQIGDMGFDYAPIANLDSEKHRFFFGNHDNRDVARPAHNVGDFGILNIANLTLFFISGGWSIDGDYRRIAYVSGRQQKSWWQDEELSWTSLESALELYTQCRPKIMLSHECPISIVPFVTNANFVKKFGYHSGTIETKTNVCLEKCLEAWQPDLWIFAHYHYSWTKQIGKTTFRCLNELESYTIND